MLNSSNVTLIREKVSYCVNVCWYFDRQYPAYYVVPFILEDNSKRD